MYFPSFSTTKRNRATPTGAAPEGRLLHEDDLLVFSFRSLIAVVNTRRRRHKHHAVHAFRQIAANLDEELSVCIHAISTVVVLQLHTVSNELIVVDIRHSHFMFAVHTRFKCRSPFRRIEHDLAADIHIGHANRRLRTVCAGRHRAGVGFGLTIQIDLERQTEDAAGSPGS